MQWRKQTRNNKGWLHIQQESSLSKSKCGQRVEPGGTQQSRTHSLLDSETKTCLAVLPMFKRKPSRKSLYSFQDLKTAVIEIDNDITVNDMEGSDVSTNSIQSSEDSISESSSSQQEKGNGEDFLDHYELMFRDNIWKFCDAIDPCDDKNACSMPGPAPLRRKPTMAEFWKTHCCQALLYNSFPRHFTSTCAGQHFWTMIRIVVCRVSWPSTSTLL